MRDSVGGILSGSVFGGSVFGGIDGVLGSSALGADHEPVNPDEMWHMQVQAAPPILDNATGVVWAKKLQTALNYMGAKLPTTGFWGDLSAAAWKKFATQYGATVAYRPAGVQDYVILCDAMGDKCSAPMAPRPPEPPPEPPPAPPPAPPKKKNKKAAAPVKAGMSTSAKVGIGLGAFALVAIGGIALYEHKKKKKKAQAGASAQEKK